MFCMYVKQSMSIMPNKTKILFYLITKRSIDIFVAFLGLVLLFPILTLIMFLIWRQDKKSPLYIAERVGKNGITFKMIKLRSMIANADKSEVDSTSKDDRRITPIGHFIRSYKLDEIMQLWNVLRGDMSLVGPRPNVKRETDLYTGVENKLIEVKPGITDFASIVFADEAIILENKLNPDITYNQLIRPWKSRLGLFYLENRNTLMDLKIIILTLYSQINRSVVLRIISKSLLKKKGYKELAQICLRDKPLQPSPPPGSSQIVTSRTKGR